MVVRPDDLVPRGFLGRLLAAFGLEWANLVILVGVLITSFGLDPYLNSGLWAFGAVASFSAVYVVRRSIGTQFRFHFICTLVLVTALAIALIAIQTYVTPLDALFRGYRNQLSVLVSVWVTAPLAVCIVSYRKQEEEERRRTESRFPALPTQLDEVIRKSVTEYPFYNHGVEFLVEFADPVGDSVRVTFEVTLSPVNRSNEVQHLQDIVDPAGSDIVYEYAVADGVSINTADPDYNSERGFVLIRDLEPGQEIRWTVRATSSFRTRDWEFFGSFFPSTSLSVYVKSPPQSLKVSFISFLSKKVDPKQLPNGDITFETREGILPFQGLKLVWQPRTPPS